LQEPCPRDQKNRVNAGQGAGRGCQNRVPVPGLCFVTTTYTALRFFSNLFSGGAETSEGGGAGKGRVPDVICLTRKAVREQAGRFRFCDERKTPAGEFVIAEIAPSPRRRGFARQERTAVLFDARPPPG
jgi:hypothetical protein